MHKLLLVALPIIGTQFILMSYNLTDMFLLGRVGSDAVAASGSAGMFLWLSNGFMLLGRMGAEIGVAQNFGRGDLRTARRFSQNAFLLAFALGLCYALVCFFFNRQLIGFFNIRETHVARDAANYLRVVSLGIPATFLSAAIVGIFNGSGNSRAPFFINTTGLVLNVILDPIFIFLLGLGVTGAAIATAIAQNVVCVLSLLALTRKADRPFFRIRLLARPEAARIAQILRWSVPIGVESILFTAFSMFISRFVAEFGAHAIAIYRVGSQIESLCWLTCVGFSTATTAFVGQNFGAGRWDRIRACVRVALFTVCSWGVFVTILLVVAGKALFGIFLRERELVESGAAFLRILAFCQIFGCLEAVAGGTFRGLGKTQPPSIVSVTSNGLRVPLSFALSRSGLGLSGLWIGMTVGAICRGLVLFLWFIQELRRRQGDHFLWKA